VVPADPAPTITCPAAQNIFSPLATAQSVSYGTALVVNGKAPVTTTCTPDSGSSFPVGTSTVTCTTVDAEQRTASCNFTVLVSDPPRIRMTNFAAFGDSITWGENGTVSILPQDGLGTVQSIQLVGQDYPTDLLKDLTSRYTAQASLLRVTNLGRPGELAQDSDTWDRFSAFVVGGGYQAVFLMEGANDILDGNPPGEQPAIDGLREMISRAKRANIQVYLAGLPPENPVAQPCAGAHWRGQSFGFIPQFNGMIQQLALVQGIPYIDVYGAFGGDLSLLSCDGLHPNAAGYQKIADAFFRAIQVTIEIPATSPAPSLLRMLTRR
jgi:lysophospholipase L1-like esterase